MKLNLFFTVVLTTTIAVPAYAQQGCWSCPLDRFGWFE